MREHIVLIYSTIFKSLMKTHSLVDTNNPSLLTPLGNHRRNYIHPSKGKKRKRNATQDEPTMSEPAPPPPEIGKHLLVGLNSVTRHLEALAARQAPSATSIAEPENTPIEVSKHTPEDPQKASNEKKQDGKTRANTDLKPLSMVILTHPKPSLSPAHAHLPTLLHLSMLSPSPSPTTTSARLIALPTSTDALLASALHIPRVGALAVYEGAPGAKALEDYVREHVGVTECAWVDEAMKAEWRGLNVKSEIPGAKAKEKA
jgi:ribonuclease P/MRP protein subunit POP3